MKKELAKLSNRIKRPLFILALFFFFTAIFIPVGTYLFFANDLKSKDKLLNKNDTGLTLLDRNSNPFFIFYDAKNERYVPLSNISINLQKAVISAEDRTFYSNPGFSITSIIRALITDISQGRIVQGGSTISQELIKISLLSSERSFFRKYQEISLAYRLNMEYSKKEIMEMYLNSIYFGEGAFGAENAAQTYFGTRARNLTLAQSALLAGLLPAPSRLSPISNDSKKALEAQRKILDDMVKNKFISKSEAENAKMEKLIFNSSRPDSNKYGQHFGFYVLDQLISKYGEETIVRSGFTVKTTLNSDWQIFAEKSVRDQVENIKANGATNGSAVVLNAKNGEILVMVGSKDWNDSKFGKFNIATSERQVGSSFKPIIYSAAFENHLITPATILQDTPHTFPPDNYKPRNYDGKFRGPVTVRRALSNSLNVPSVEVMQMVGVPTGLEMAKRLGITTLNPETTNYGLSLVLGAGDIKLLELTNVYATFANDGVYNPPTGILEIKDKYGSIVYKNKVEGKRVIEDGVAFLVSSILSDNNARREIFGNTLTISRPAAVKTGTTNDYRDALTLGYTPSLSIGVWVGNNDNAPMDNIAGSLGAAPIWKDLMEHFSSGTPVENFTKPFSVIGVQTCSSQVATASGNFEYFLAGTEPTRICPRTPFPRSSRSPIPITITPSTTLVPTTVTPSTAPSLGPTVPSQ
ncbi:MAG: PBP1A family penicillin-binding protein [Actinobacteria bacterium]|nr:PBP1A family penicillin-binding protein [Actinomycetota bacterium]